MAGRDRSGPPVYVYDIPVDVLHHLSNTLDVDKGWLNLAAECGYDYDEVKRFELEYLRPYRSPTESMLQDWGARNHTVHELYHKLKKVRRIREMKLLEPLLIGKRRSSNDSNITSVSRQTSVNLAMNTQFHHPQRQSSRASSVTTNPDAGHQAEGASNTRAQHHDGGSSPNNIRPSRTNHYVHPDDAGNLRDEYNSLNSHEIQKHNNNSKPSTYHTDVNQLPAKTTAHNYRKPATPRVLDTAEFSRTQQQQMTDTLTALTASRTGYRNAAPSSDSKDTNAHMKPVLSRSKLLDYSVLSVTQSNYSPVTQLNADTVDQDILVAMAATASFTYKELSCATGGFADESKIGEGAFGEVYVGMLKQTKCAIKKLKQGDNVRSEEEQLLQHAAEMKALLRFRHENIVQLYGFSVDNGEICLVYQFMENGSLHDRLHATHDTPPLDWLQRLNILVGAACGLQYLHTVQDRPLVHGDIKSANVLLDRYFEAKLADFGLAQCADSGSVTGVFTHVTRRDLSDRVYGTRAYLPPEFFMAGGTASVKSDCFGFGVIMLEACSGEKAYDERREPDKFMADYCENIFDDQPESDWPQTLQDGKGGYCPSSVVIAVLCLAQKCIDEKPQRPPMAHVLQELRLICQELESKVGRDVAHRPSYDATSLPYESSSNFGYVNQMGLPMRNLSHDPLEEELSVRVPEAIQLQLKYDQQRRNKECDGGAEKGQRARLWDGADAGWNCENQQSETKQHDLNTSEILREIRSHGYAHGGGTTADYTGEYHEMYAHDRGGRDDEYTCDSITHVKGLAIEADAIKQALLNTDSCLRLTEADSGTHLSQPNFQRKTSDFYVPDDVVAMLQLRSSEADETKVKEYEGDGVTPAFAAMTVDCTDLPSSDSDTTVEQHKRGGSLDEPSLEHSVSGSAAAFQSCPTKYKVKPLDKKMGDFFRLYMNDLREVGGINEDVYVENEGVCCEDQEYDDEGGSIDESAVESYVSCYQGDEYSLNLDHTGGIQRNVGDYFDDENAALDAGVGIVERTAVGELTVGDVKLETDGGHGIPGERRVASVDESVVDGLRERRFRDTDVLSGIDFKVNTPKHSSRVDTGVGGRATERDINMDSRQRPSVHPDSYDVYASDMINNLAQVRQFDRPIGANAVMHSMPYNINCSPCFNAQDSPDNRSPYSMPYGLPRNISVSSGSDLDDTNRVNSGESWTSMSHLSEEGNDLY